MKKKLRKKPFPGSREEVEQAGRRREEKGHYDDFS